MQVVITATRAQLIGLTGEVQAELALPRPASATSVCCLDPGGGSVVVVGSATSGPCVIEVCLGPGDRLGLSLGSHPAGGNPEAGPALATLAIKAGHGQAAGLQASGELCLWQFNAGRALTALPLLEPRLPAAVTSIATCPRRPLALCTGPTRRVLLLDTEDMTARQVCMCLPAIGSCFGPGKEPAIKCGGRARTSSSKVRGPGPAAAAAASGRDQQQERCRSSATCTASAVRVCSRRPLPAQVEEAAEDVCASALHPSGLLALLAFPSRLRLMTVLEDGLGCVRPGLWRVHLQG